MGKDSLVILRVGVLIAVFIWTSKVEAQYMNRYRKEELISDHQIDGGVRDSYLPDPPVLGLKPPYSKDILPRNDRTPVRGYMKPSHTRSRYRNNFGKGKRMRRPPGPFKVIGKRKTCTYKRKLVKQPQQRPNRRYGRSHPKMNLLSRNFLEEQKPTKYYNNLPNQGPFIPKRSHIGLDQKDNLLTKFPVNFHNPMKKTVHRLNLDKYRIFIHQYSDDNDMLVPTTKSPKTGSGGQEYLVGTNSPYHDSRRYLMDNSNLWKHKTDLLPDVLPAFVTPPPQKDTKINSPMSVRRHKNPLLVRKKDWPRKSTMIVQSHHPNFHYDKLDKNKFYSSAIRLEDDASRHHQTGYKELPMTTIAIKTPTPLTHHGNVASNFVIQSENSSRPEHLHTTTAPLLTNTDGKKVNDRQESSAKEMIVISFERGTSTTQIAEKGITEKHSVGVIYVTPEPYTGEWSEWSSATDRNNNNAVTEAEIIVGQIKPSSVSPVSRTKKLCSGEHFFTCTEDEWRPIYPDPEDINRWFETVTIAPNGHWVELPKK